MPWPKISNRTFHDNISKDCLSSYQSQGESDGVLPNGVLFFESVDEFLTWASVTVQMKQSRLFAVIHMELFVF